MRVSRVMILWAWVLMLATGWSREVDPIVALATRLKESRNPSVLFVGNSYSFDVPKMFRTYANNRGKKVRVKQVTRGGWTLKKHVEDGVVAREIREGKWDVVVFQEQSRIPSLPPKQRAALMDGPLVELVKLTRASGALPALYQTWGYRDGDAKLAGDDFTAMTRRVREGYQAAAVRAGNVAIVPVGDAWEREAGKGVKLFAEDGSHPSRTGNQVTARVFYETFFPKT